MDEIVRMLSEAFKKIRVICSTEMLSSLAIIECRVSKDVSSEDSWEPSVYLEITTVLISAIRAHNGPSNYEILRDLFRIKHRLLRLIDQ